MPTQFTGYTHYPGSSDLYGIGPGETFLQRWQRLAGLQPAIPGVSPWASTWTSAVNSLAQPNTRTTTAGMPQQGAAVLPGVPVVSMPTLSGQNVTTGSQSTGNRVLTGDATPPFTALTAERSPQISSVAGPLFGDWQNLRTGVQANQAQFNQAYPGFLNKAGEFATQETGVVSRYFDDSIKKDLADLRANLLKANQGIQQTAAGNFIRANSIGELGLPTGSAPAGFNSGRARINEGVAREFDRQALAADAEQAMRDYQWQEAAKQGLLGQREAIALRQIQNLLFPQQADVASFNALAQAGQIPANLELANRITGIQGPGGFVGDSFGGVQGAYAQDLARRSGIDMFNANQNQQAQMFNANLGLNLQQLQQNALANDLQRLALTRQGSTQPNMNINITNPLLAYRNLTAP